VRQRSSRVGVLFILAVASLHRVRQRSSRVAVAVIYIFRGFVFCSCLLPTEIRSGPVAVPDRPSCSRGEVRTTTHHAPHRSHKLLFIPRPGHAPRSVCVRGRLCVGQVRYTKQKNT
jgi:hypothetical protein